MQRIFPGMLIPDEALNRLDRDYARDAFTGWTYDDALAWLTAAWQYASAMSPVLGSDWQTDLQPDLEIARVLNGVARAA